MNTKRSKLESGQSLATVAAISVGLFAILVLAIDVGYVYAMRRVAQNAADAGALAGATAMCGTAPDAPGVYTTAINNAIAAANKYSGDEDILGSLNRIFGVNSQEATASVNTTTAEVTVTVATNFNNFFARFFNQTTSNAPATATAGCFIPGAGLGVIPVAWECRTVLPDGSLDPTCDLKFRDTDNTCTFGLDPYYVFIDSTYLFACSKTVPFPVGAQKLNCDANGDGDETDDVDIHLINTANPEQGWFWADLTGSCNSTACLTNMVQYGFQSPLYPHTWVYGNMGVKVPVFTSINTYHDEDVVILPVFDDKCEGADPQTVCPFGWQPNRGWHPNDTKILSSSNSPTKFYFHLISFALFNVKCTAAGNLKHCPGRDRLEEINKIPQENSFEGCFVNGYVPGLIGQQGWGNPMAGAWTVYLTK
jgi:hypothetical protein